MADGLERRKLFMDIFRKAERKYRLTEKRLAAEGWEHDWQTLVATIMSAQSRDETTLPIAEALFEKYPTMGKLSKARYKDVLRVFRSLNYNRTKARHVIAAARIILREFGGKVPDTMDDLLRIPGVGRKVANIVLIEVHGKLTIAVDTHVHRLANVLGLVETKTPEQTEFALKELVPRKYWHKVNHIFVLWGQDAPGRDKKKLLEALE